MANPNDPKPAKEAAEQSAAMRSAQAAHDKASDHPHTDLRNAQATAVKADADAKAAQKTADRATADKLEAERLHEDRLPNPLLKSDVRSKNDEAEEARLADVNRKMTKADVIRLWAGGEHQRAMDLYHSLKLSDADQAEVKAACPKWEELAVQYGGPKPPSEDGPSPPPLPTKASSKDKP